MASAEFDTSAIIREVEEFFRGKTVDTDHVHESPSEDVKLLQSEVYDHAQELLQKIEIALFKIPDYVRSAAQAHFDGNRSVTFEQGENIYCIENNKKVPYLRVARGIKQPDGNPHIVEVIHIDSDSDVSSYEANWRISYVSPTVYRAVKLSGKIQRIPKFNTQAVIDGGYRIISDLEKLAS